MVANIHEEDTREEVTIFYCFTASNLHTHVQNYTLMCMQAENLQSLVFDVLNI